MEHIIILESRERDVYMKDFREWFWRDKLRTSILDKKIYKHVLRCKACGRELEWYEGYDSKSS